MDNEKDSPLQILLVEDNPGDRRLTEIALSEAASDADMHCELHAVGTLADGLARLGDPACQVAVVLLDLGLPDAVGLGGLRAARIAAPSVPIVVLTGLSDLAIATEALKGGASDYLDKADLRPRTLVRAIRYAIERKKAEAELMQLARTDSLTGLLNRRAFFEQLEAALVQTRRSELACAVILFDIDRFKEINDIFGHKTGDELLVAVADVLRTQLRETDSLGRIGGDEFAVLATNLKSAAAAMEIAEKIAKGVGAITELDDVRVEISISVGMSVFPLDDSTADVLVTHADMAMYKSKASKRGSINYFDARMDAAVKARHALKRCMPQDIANGKFYLMFQPIVDARTRRIVGAEGLARWRDTNNRLIAPDEFIPIAEESGSIAELGGRLLAEACGYLRHWAELHKAPVPISLNISPIQCRDPGFAARLINAIEQASVKPSLINIEITESTMSKGLEMIQKNLAMVRAFGIGISIDDFGTGFSSLSLLKDLPLSALKIDRSFVRDIGKGTGAETIVHAIVEMAKNMGFRTVAEGVETEEQVGMLRDTGVDELQGYYFSKPVLGEQFAAWLLKSESYLVA
jgi:diguanylate cyclase (GGDEF)-like protein